MTPKEVYEIVRYMLPYFNISHDQDGFGGLTIHSLNKEMDLQSKKIGCRHWSTSLYILRVWGLSPIWRMLKKSGTFKLLLVSNTRKSSSRTLKLLLASRASCHGWKQTLFWWCLEEKGNAWTTAMFSLATSSCLYRKFVQALSL
jgi:hypothetical protein